MSNYSERGKDVPHWTMPDIQALKEMAEQGRSVEDISSTLNRSAEAIRLKARRMGVPVVKGGRARKT